ncbi:MAG TPA: BrnA antitoxin family protein [Roseiarcus sp.]
MTSKKFAAKRPLTDDEEAEIQRMIASDPDNPELTDDQIAGLRPLADVLPALAESVKRGPGRPRLEKTLEAVTLRLDPAIVERFRAQGANWRKRMARVLAKAAS